MVFTEERQQTLSNKKMMILPIIHLHIVPNPFSFLSSFP